jgi:LacI family transcriptional regulator
MSSSKILYLGLIEETPVQKMKLAGVRRYTDARRWEVVPLPAFESSTGRLNSPLRAFRPFDDSAPEVLRSLLQKYHPIGCILDWSGIVPDIPLSLFGHVPAVHLDTASGRRGPAASLSVSGDEEAVVRMAMRELSANRPASFATVEYQRYEHHASSGWPSVRANAFRALAAETGRPCAIFRTRVSETLEERAARLAAWLKRLPLPCGIFGVTDGTAHQVRAACRAAYLSVPRDISIIGVDNDPGLCEDEKPFLSSIQLDFERAGFLAARMLGERIAQATSDKRRCMRQPPASRVSPEKPAPVTFGPLMAVRRKSTSGRGRREPRILKAVEIIRAEACDGLTAEALAARFDGSRKHFERRFREAMGHSVLDEILHVRLERVRTLLATTEMPVSAIADFCGFGTDRELRWLFRKRTGVSLRQWRADHVK